MKYLSSFLFMLLMCSPSLSQNVVGVWAMEKSGIDDSVKYDVKSLMRFEKGGRFQYGHTFKLGESVYTKLRTGEWKISDTHKIKIIVRMEETKDYSVIFRNLNFLNFFMLHKNRSSGVFYDGFFKIEFEKVSNDGSIERTPKAKVKVLAEKDKILI